MSKYRIVPYVKDWASGNNRYVWKIEKETKHYGFWKNYSTWKEVEWYEDLRLEFPNENEYRQELKYRKNYPSSYISYKKHSYDTQELAQRYIDKHLQVEMMDDLHRRISPREYP